MGGRQPLRLLHPWHYIWDSSDKESSGDVLNDRRSRPAVSIIREYQIDRQLINGFLHLCKYASPRCDEERGTKKAGSI